jgi:hypothetical protein
VSARATEAGGENAGVGRLTPVVGGLRPMGACDAVCCVYADRTTSAENREPRAKDADAQMCGRDRLPLWLLGWRLTRRAVSYARSIYGFPVVAD